MSSIEWINPALKEVKNTTNESISLKLLLIDKLQDHKISPDEAQILSKYMHDILNKKSQVRNEWKNLSLDIKKDFQEKIWTEVDGFIWPKTMAALNTLGTAPKLRMSPDFNETVEHISESIEDIWKVVTDTADKVENILNVEPQNKTQTDNPLFLEKTKYHPEDNIVFSLWTTNDSTGLQKSDTGNTFWFQWWLKTMDWKAQASFNAYTHGENWYIWNNGEKYVDFTNSERNDKIWLNYQTSIYSKYNENWSYINIYAWWWVDIVWDYNWSDIQNSWHDFIWAYEHKGNYENISWFSPTVNISAEWKKVFDLNNNVQTYISGDISAQVALNNNYWENNIKWGLWAWIEFDNISLWVESNIQYQTWMEASHVLSDTFENNNPTTRHGIVASYTSESWNKFSLHYGKKEIKLQYTSKIF